MEIGPIANGAWQRRPFIHTTVIGGDQKLAAYPNARKIPGVAFISVRFVPGLSYPFHGQLHKRSEFFITDWNLLDSSERDWRLRRRFYKLHPEMFQIDQADKSFLNASALDANRQG